MAESTWTPELREEFRAHVNKFFDDHPGLRESLSDEMSQVWDSDEADDMKRAMSEAART